MFVNIAQFAHPMTQKSLNLGKELGEHWKVLELGLIFQTKTGTEFGIFFEKLGLIYPDFQLWRNFSSTKIVPNSMKRNEFPRQQNGPNSLKLYNCTKLPQ
jgi:hypothetical protein